MVIFIILIWYVVCIGVGVGMSGIQKAETEAEKQLQELPIGTALVRGFMTFDFEDHDRCVHVWVCVCV